MELLQVKIAAGETKRFEKAGRYVEIIDANYPVTLNFYDRNGSQGDEAINALSGFFVQGDFSAFELVSATAQTVTLLLTDGNGGSRRQPGIVQIVDSAKSRTLANQAFVAAVDASSGVGGRYQRAGIWNPAGSGVRLVVDSMRATSPVQSLIYFAMVNTACATVDALFSSKLFGGSMPAGARRTYEDTAAFNQGVSTIFVGTGTDLSYVPKTPVIVPPGYGFIAASATVGGGMVMSCEFIEEPNT